MNCPPRIEVSVTGGIVDVFIDGTPVYSKRITEQTPSAPSETAEPPSEAEPLGYIFKEDLHWLKKNGNCTLRRDIYREHPADEEVAVFSAFSTKAPEAPRGVTDEMVNRFLSWKLPDTFNPDGGISFKKAFNEYTPFPGVHEPSGTNLFDAEQARAMLEHVLKANEGDAPSETAFYRNEARALYEAPEAPTEGVKGIDNFAPRDMALIRVALQNLANTADDLETRSRATAMAQVLRMEVKSALVGKSVEVSKPGAAIQVHRVELTDAGRAALTTSASAMASPEPAQPREPVAPTPVPQEMRWQIYRAATLCAARAFDQMTNSHSQKMWQQHADELNAIVDFIDDDAVEADQRAAVKALPSPEPAELPDKERDAARYRWLRRNYLHIEAPGVECIGIHDFGNEQEAAQLDAKIDEVVRKFPATSGVDAAIPGGETT